MANRVINSLPIEEFQSGTDDFESWIELFDTAIAITYKGATDQDKEIAARQWLPLKLDDQARLTLSNVTGEDWATLKNNLQKALIDPQDEERWNSRTPFITWDGVESFQSLATRVKRATDRFHRGDKEQEYYNRFDQALPFDYNLAFSFNIPKENRTIENALPIAERVRASLLKNKEKETATSNALFFTGAAMSNDEIEPLEQRMRSVTSRLENMELNATKESDNVPLNCRDEARLRLRSSSRNRGRRDDR